MTEANSLRANGTNDFSWHQSTMIVTKDNIDEFVLLSNRRDLRPSKVTKLTRLLKAGKHFETPMVVNKRADKMRLIDGNHRHLSMERFFEAYPDRRVRVAVVAYDNLSDEEEKEKYTIWNSGTKQTTNDFIKQHWDSVPAFKKMQKARGFPWDVDYKWSANKMEVKLILNAFFVRNWQANYPGPGTMAGPEFIERCKSLSPADVALMSEFMKEYIEQFGIPTQTSPYYRPAVFSVLADIWFRNAGSDPQVAKKLSRVIGHQKTLEWAKQVGSIQNCQFARSDLVMVINGNRRTGLVE